MNTYPGIITSRRTRKNLRHFRLLPVNPQTESAVQFRAARALNQLSSHASLLVRKWRHCRNSTNYQHHIWRPEKISNSVTLFALSDASRQVYTPPTLFAYPISSGYLEYNDPNSRKKSFDRFSFCHGNLCIFPAKSYMEYPSLLFWRCSWTTRCRKPRAADAITRTESELHDNSYFTNQLQIISYNQEILYATLRSSYHYLIRSK